LVLKASKKCKEFLLPNVPEYVYLTQWLCYGLDKRGQEISLFWATFRTTPVVIHPSIRWVQIGAVSSEVKRRGREAENSPPFGAGYIRNASLMLSQGVALNLGHGQLHLIIL
jgi:hypothetical protein